MGLFSFIKSGIKTPVKLIVYLDAGKGSARGAIVQIKNGLPHILYTILGEQRVGESVNATKALHASSLSSLEEILEQMARLLRRSANDRHSYIAEEVYCILAAPYYLSHTAIINHKEPSPVLLSKSFIKDIIEKDKIEDTTAHADSPIGDSKRTLHEKIVDIKINGYHNNNPYNKYASEVSVAVFKTQVDLNLYENISKMVRKFTPAPLHIESLSLAAFVSLRNRVDAKPDFLFITIGNEATEVSLVKNHTLLETTSFPFGKFSFARFLSNKTTLPPDIALSKIALYHDKKLHADEMAKFKEVSELAQAEWFSYLEESMVSLSKEINLPKQIYLVVDTELKDIFEQTVTQKGFASQALVPNGFDIHTLDTAKFVDCCTFGLDIRFDTLLAISATFAGAFKDSMSEIYPQKS